MIWKHKERGRLAEREENADYKERVLNSNAMTFQQHLTICAAQIPFKPVSQTDSILFIATQAHISPAKN